MIRKLSVFLILLLLTQVVGCHVAEPPPVDQITYQVITADEAYRIIQETDDVVILDVRTQAEFESGHIEGALLIPHNQLKESASELLPRSDQVILIYCRSGNRSAQSAKLLIELGYIHVFDFGGILDWPYDIIAD
jgi:rhodanese-related sulfurtransferase